MGKLSKQAVKSSPRKLTASERLEVPFVLSFKYPLESGYTFSEMEKDDLKKFQSFLNRVAQMTYNQADRLYRKKPDKTDRFNDQPVIHYEVAQAFRIHGVIENSRFKVIRLDPHHRFHD